MLRRYVLPGALILAGFAAVGQVIRPRAPLPYGPGPPGITTPEAQQLASYLIAAGYQQARITHVVPGPIGYGSEVYFAHWNGRCWKRAMFLLPFNFEGPVSKQRVTELPRCTDAPAHRTLAALARSSATLGRMTKLYDGQIHSN